MGDMGDIFGAMKQHGQRKRRSNLENSTDILMENQIHFESKNNGIHLIVQNEFDFYPSTGLFKNRKTNKKGRGIFSLIKILKKNV